MMKRTLVGPALALLLAVSAPACGDPPPPPVAPAPPPPAPPPVVEAPPPAPALPPEPTAEEKKKAEQMKALEADKAKFADEQKAESARWTADLHAQAKTLAEKTFPNGKAAIQAAMASKTRRPGDADRDKYRHPDATLDFLGFRPGMTVLEFGPGEGWYTELLAPALGKKGKLIVTGSDPNGPPDERSTFNGQRWKAFLDTAPELYGNGKTEVVVIDGKNPKLPQEGSVDMVLLFRELHGMVQNGKMDAWLGEVNKALKPNGILGIEQHRAKADAVPEEAAKKGYLPEKWVIEKIEAAGFKLAGKSEINANAKDTKDYAEGVWTLPPSFRLGDKDKEKYAAIGESDRMTLKFTKAAKPIAKSGPGAPAAPAPAKK